MRNQILVAGARARAFTVAAAFFSMDAVASAQGLLVQKPLPGGCVSDGGGSGCATGFALTNAQGVAVSPDGESVYVLAFITDSLTTFDRNGVTGILTQKIGTNGCVSESGGGDCADGRALQNVERAVVTSDNAFLYSAAFNGVAAFERNTTTGVLTQLAGTDGCTSSSGNDGECVDGIALTGCNDIALSPDSMQVYVSCANSEAVSVFDRNPATGVLMQKAGVAGCHTTSGDGGLCTVARGLNSADGIAVSPDGQNVYAAGASSDAVAIFDRDATTGALTQKAGTAGCIAETAAEGCAVGEALAQATAVVVSPDGANVYVTSGGSSGKSAIAVFSRDVVTGELTQLAGTDGCVSASGHAGLCSIGRGIVSPFGLAISSDGLNVYTASEDSHGVASFDRDPVSGVLTQRNCASACVTDDGTGFCLDGTALRDAYAVVLSPDDAHGYVAAISSDAVSVFDRDPGVCLTTTTSTSTSTTTTMAPGPCPPDPRTDCRSGTGGQTKLIVRPAGTGGLRKIQFVWSGGDATPFAAFGDPISGDASVHLCVYDESLLPQPVTHLAVPPGGVCPRGPCWTRVDERGLRYLDSSAAVDGVRRISLRSSGATAFMRPRVLLVSRSPATPLPALPLALPVTAQVVIDDGGPGECWEAEYPGARKNGERRFEGVTH